MKPENYDLTLIKKYYGENMMHLCRYLFPTFLETKGLLFKTLSSKFAPTKSLFDDIKENNCEAKFKNYIYSFLKQPKELVKTEKSPFELLKEKGYILYHCRSEEDIQTFKKYYAKGEELCTFNGGRNKRCHVFFAVRENAWSIKRESFVNPKRQDEYGTSVISIQFTRGEINTISIKNRYNHTVNNPDATFSNNLENIIPGLTYSFQNYYGFNIVNTVNEYSEFLTDELWYVLADDGKYYRYNHELNGIYYCENNIIVDKGHVIDKYAKEKERYIVADYFIIDRKEKTIFLYDNTFYDSFPESIYEVGNIKEIQKNHANQLIICYDASKKVIISLDKNNNIISYQNDYVQRIKRNFLFSSSLLTAISLANVLDIDDNFLQYNQLLTNINLPNIQVIGLNFLQLNEIINKEEFINQLKGNKSI